MNRRRTDESAVPALMSLQQVADATPWSLDTIRKAVRATDPNTFPPPLRAKKAGKGYVVTRRSFDAWIDSLPDA